MLLVPLSEYDQTLIDLIKEFGKKNICYVTLNKTADLLKQF
ncbi:MAG: hypothetical protein AABX96_02160 [Nanoarchaeota archaeon]